jgi:hypothetical protein
MSHTIFAIAFARDGLECIVDLSQIDQTYLLAKMANETPLPESVNQVLHMLKIRAQFNQQRNMEVWLVKTSDLSEDDLKYLGETDPQGLADFARLGTAFYTNKDWQKRSVIV